MAKEKRHYRLKSKTSLLIPALVWLFVIIYMVGSRSIFWSDGMLAMRVCGVMLLIATVFVIKREIVSMNEEEYQAWRETAKEPIFTDKVKKNWMMVGFLVIYLALLNPLGFAVDTCLFILGVLLWLGVRKVPVLVLAPLLTSGVLFYVFKFVLYIRLPLGILSGIL